MVVAASTVTARRNIFLRSGLKPFLLFNGVADPPYRFYEPWVSGGLAQLFPQPSDVGHDGVIAVQVFFTPHCLKQFLGGDDNPLFFTEIPEDGKLDGSQLDFLPEQETLVVVLGDDQPPDVIFMDRVLRSEERRVGKECRL